MSERSLTISGLSKRYRIGVAEETSDSLVTALGRSIRRPVANLNRLRRLASFKDGADGATDIIWALKDVSFEVNRGEVVGVIGRNGAGKSTLLKILAKITEPTTGRAEIRGKVASLLEVGTGFHSELTGRDNVYLNGSILGMRRAEIDRKFDEIVAFSGVEKFIDTPVKRYSSGMSVRLAFSVAAHLEPEILLVDEVLAVGDVEFQRKCLGKIRNVTQEEGRTVLFVSHNMSAVTRMCDRGILLSEGQVVADGPSRDVVAQYLTSELGSMAKRQFSPNAPEAGNEWVKVRSVRIVDEDRATAHSVDVREPLGIEIVIDIFDSRSAFVPMIALYDEQGVHIMNAMDTDPAWLEPRGPGRYVSTAWLPRNLLAEGTISVSVILSTISPRRSEKQARIQDAVAVRMVDLVEGDSARGNYVGPWGGAVRPLLQWTTERSKLSADELNAAAPELLEGRVVSDV